MAGWRIAGALALLVVWRVDVAAQPPQRTGKELYSAACAACHGPDGRGHIQSRVGFDTPLPDFTDCSFATPEPDADWAAVVAHGGPVRAFDRMMPAFGEALSAAEIERVVTHVRGFCPGSGAWPRGELNLPRALATEKAFPENEAVVTVSIDDDAAVSEWLYERRLGARSQWEVVVPLAAGQPGSGLGDIALALKHVVVHSLASGSILSAAAEVKLPTGREADGLGSGTTMFEPFVAFGQILPAEGFLQLQSGVEIPAPSGGAKEAFWRAAIGRSFIAGGYGRTWSPMVEVLGARELESGAVTHWDLVPQMQVTLSKRQHVMVSAGVRIPANDRQNRGAALLTYLLWDWFDGGFFDGWR